DMVATPCALRNPPNWCRRCSARWHPREPASSKSSSIPRCRCSTRSRAASSDASKITRSVPERSNAMQASDKAFAGSIPEIYDSLMVPLIFEVYARDLASRVARLAPSDVLETAAGTGVVTVALASQLPVQCRIVASDLNQPMLDRAATKPALQGRVTFQQADALGLPCEEGKFDVVACQFGVMFFPDRVKGYKEARRVLKPGGRFVFNVWDEIGTNDFANAVHQSLATGFPKDPPAFMARTPHG